ncbi:MAG TPA: flippase-like domain-containing protein [Candidatus Syntrophoarchaeum butanivorans]|uniref:Flippase-like domain-containing protein n=1 Tax=Candidatus Syntropharchaeum butanivorans TaxID=1839936 RepID=A0A1F2P651_9EURY|nr:MAG: protein belonging to Lysylphosphatidylglycerol synthetase/UPF0104 [Candidatus Syntrophoarchaeum butanivorans]HEC56347.1 flippase-like domain-containing protein [Candidatus Syntrophoarchaeum butanivorans]
MKKRLLQVIIGIAIIALILHRLGPYAVYEVFTRIDLSYFIIAAAAYLTYDILMAVRLSYLLKVISNHDIPFQEIFSAHIGGMIASDVTPARSGYFLTPVFLRRKDENLTLIEGMAAILAPQGIEFILKVAGSLLGAFLLITTLKNVITTPLLFAGAIFLVLGGLTLLILWSGEESSLKILSKIPVMKRFVDEFARLKEESIKIRSEVPFILLLYMICWVLVALQWMFIGKSLGFNLSFPIYFLLHPLLSILAFVPITPAGLGVMESGMIGVLYLFGIDPAMGFAFSLLVRANTIAVDLIGIREVTLYLRPR